jgi:hypothetical protein
VIARRWLLAAAALLPGAALACSSILGFKDLTPLDAGAEDANGDVATADAAPDGASDAPPADAGGETTADTGPEGGGCDPAVPVGAPTTDDTPDGGDGGVDIYFAAQTLDLGQSTPGQFNPNDPLGFDLDGVCTCIDDGGPSCTSASTNCDTAGGRDEGANKMLAALGAADPGLSQQSLEARIAKGDFGFVIHVYGYNGQANDENVDVEYFPSPGTEAVNGDAPFDGGADPATVWDVTAGSVLDGDPGTWVSKYQDLQAYVNNRVLVSHLATFPLLVLPDTGGNANPITFQLAHLVLQATLTNTAGSWSLQGQVGARWSTSDALYSLHTLADPSDNSLCGNDLLYQSVAGFLCGAADIASSPANDGQGKPCDGLSVGLGFTAASAHIGNAFDPVIVPDNCPDGWAPACP